MTDLEIRYWGSFFILIGLCAATFLYGNKKQSSIPKEKKFGDFQTNYLIIYLLAMFSDWLQGPYVYQLYVSYGFSAYEISLLFVGGFGSSLVFGTFIGGLADKYGRKLTCLVYSACYIAACLTKTVPEFWTLMLGRILSGVSTSLLFSSFESWMVCEHHKLGFDPSLIGETFSLATFGNGVVAVMAGLISNVVASMYGYVSPFLAAIIPLSVCAYLVSTTWSENYGNADSSAMTALSTGFAVVRRNKRVAFLGLGQSCFEGAMYIFVFMWTPAMKTTEEEAAEANKTELDDATSKYLGLIFAAFMVCVMIGSSIFKIMNDVYGPRVGKLIPIGMHAVTLGAIAITCIMYNHKLVVYFSFLLFEVCCGIFYPAYGVIKSDEIPEDVRSMVMNIFRIPLNLIVVFILIIKNMHPRIVFTICFFAHGIALASYMMYYKLAQSPDSKEMRDMPYSSVSTSDKV